MLAETPGSVPVWAYDRVVPVESAPDAKDGRVGVPIRSALRHLDPEEIRELVRVETRNREVHLPPVSAYRWWARRTESINGAIIDAFEGDRGSNLLISDPFAGGGVIPLAVVLRGHRLYAQDLNPWAAEGLATMLRLAASHEEIAAAATRLGQTVQPLIDKAYGTTFSDGEPAEISHTFRVASACCTACGRRERLYPHALVSLKRRKERDLPEAFLACAAGHLFEGRNDREQPCPECRLRVAPEADYTRGRVLT